MLPFWLRKFEFAPRFLKKKLCLPLINKKKRSIFGSRFYLPLQVKFGVTNLIEEEFFSVRTNIITYVPPHSILEDGSKNLPRNVFIK
jgi:hypothetical protein